MGIPASPTTAKKHGSKTLDYHAPLPPPPPDVYPPQHVVNVLGTTTTMMMMRSAAAGGGGGPYASPRVHNHRRAISMPASPVGGAGAPALAPFFSSSGAAARFHLHTPDNLSHHQRKVMEAAIAAECAREAQCKAQELHMTADELRAVLKQERRRSAKMAADLASYKNSTVQQQLESEILEEGRLNDLRKRVDHLQLEKEKIILEMEREEEEEMQFSHNLGRKLQDVRREQDHLETQIEQERRQHDANRNSNSTKSLSKKSSSQLEQQDESVEEDE